MSDRPIDLERRRSAMRRMSALEKEFRALKSALCSPEQLATLALGEATKNEHHFKMMTDALGLCTPWVLEQMALYGAWMKLSGKNPSPTDALALVTKNTAFSDDVFKAAIAAKIAQLEDEINLS